MRGPERRNTGGEGVGAQRRKEDTAREAEDWEGWAEWPALSWETRGLAKETRGPLDATRWPVEDAGGVVEETGGLTALETFPQRLCASPTPSGKGLSVSRSESVAVQELVGAKEREGGATMAAGLSVYAHSTGLSVEKYDGVKGAWGEALKRGTIRIEGSVRREGDSQ